MDFVTLDFETANASRASVCSVGIVAFKDGKIVNEYYELIKPKNSYFHPINTSIHGITYDDVKHSADFATLWPEIKGMLDGNLVFAHNAAFDMSCLRGVLDDYGTPYPNLSYNCTVTIAKAVWPNLANYKLNNVSRQLGYRFSHHNALDDARACGNIVVNAMQHAESDTIENLLTRYSLPNGLLFPGGYKTPKGRKIFDKTL